MQHRHFHADCYFWFDNKIVSVWSSVRFRPRVGRVVTLRIFFLFLFFKHYLLRSTKGPKGAESLAPRQLSNAGGSPLPDASVAGNKREGRPIVSADSTTSPGPRRPEDSRRERSCDLWKVESEKLFYYYFYFVYLCVGGGCHRMCVGSDGEEIKITTFGF